METLSRAQARRVALAAQGFKDPRHTAPTMRTFNRTLGRTGVLQVDSVNVLQRAHYMPLFGRLGSYDRGCSIAPAIGLETHFDARGGRSMRLPFLKSNSIPRRRRR